MRLVFFIKRESRILIKSKKGGFPVGTVHTYNGKKFQKQSGGEWTQVKVGKKGPGTPEIPFDKKKGLSTAKRESKVKYRHEQERKEYTDVPQGFSAKWKTKKWNKRLGELIGLKTEKKKLGYKINKLNSKKIDILHKDINKRNSFVMENKEFLFNEVHQLHRFFGERSDPVQSAYEGFILAIERADPKRPDDFQQFARDYIRGYAMNKIKEDVKQKEHETSANRTVRAKGSEEGGKAIELEDTLPGKATEIGNVEFRSTVSHMAKRIKNAEAKKILAYMVMGHTKADIAKIMKHTKGWVTKKVDKHIKPIASKYLTKSGVLFARLLQRIMEN